MGWTTSPTVTLTAGWADLLFPLIPATPGYGTGTAVREVVIRVERDETGNLVKWRTGYEVRNLGFNIYRGGPGGWVRLNPSLIAGSALIAGPNGTLTAGNSYRWWDPDGSAGALYWVESIDLSGQRELHGPAQASGQLVSHAEKGSSPLLSRVPPNAFSITSSYSGQGVTYVAAPPTMSQQKLQWDIASDVAVKIGVRAEGWYVISRTSLLAAGLSRNANPQFLHLFADGIELPLLLRGAQNKSFDSIAFYGTGLDTPSTDTHVYWLTVGNSPGLRIKTDPLRVSRGTPPASFPYTVARSDKLYYAAGLLIGDDADNFFGPVIGSDPVDQTLTVHHSVSGGITPTLQVSVQGFTDGPHTVNVQFNGSNLGAVSLAGQDQGLGSFPLSPSALKEGDNIITLISIGGSGDMSLAGTVSLTYAHSYVMDGPMQRFTAPPGPLTVTSTSSQVQFFDISDPTEVHMITALRGAAGTSYSYQFSVGNGTERTLWAVRTPNGTESTILAVQTPSGILQPASITANQPSQWHESNNRAELVIISHSTLLASAARLAAFRTSQGFSTAVVNVEDLYDEFSFGAKDPAALRSFLQLASSRWKTAPRFVLLMGDATFDPRNYLGLGGDVYDMVPTREIDTASLKTASDDWFADFAGTGVPAMAIGRLPARTSADADLMVSKIIGYEQGAGSGSWRRQILFVADTSDDYDFQGEAASFAPLVPHSMAVATVLRGTASDDATSSQICGDIENGTLIVDYIGHGSEEVWRGNLLTSDTALTLSNGSMLPFFIDMTCLNALFQDLYMTSLGESLMLAPDGGAVGVWASSGLTDAAPQAIMNRAMLQAMFGATTPTLGEAILQAKAAISDNDVRRTWILLGDPTTKIR
jgi:hypothetical protein